MRKQHIARWVLIFPATFVVASLCLMILILASSMNSQIDMVQIYFWFVVGGDVTAGVWVYTSYFIAPSHKTKTVWISYLVGFAFVLLTHLPIHSLPWLLSFLSASTCGLLVAIYLHVKEHRRYSQLVNMSNEL